MQIKSSFSERSQTVGGEEDAGIEDEGSPSISVLFWLTFFVVLFWQCNAINAE